ncbi:NAD(P)H-dependent oxidoreductase [Microbacterium betulae]|uniref:NAD(P)H-dependent oxidoreductase n=1 Tax=Microbacterium betulae TaxID=2981139 RepID=A0AA97I6P8_9MICO|nr:NAD(P)H-dependent oxidoreductase [Microbacterium sp. AB]WOF24074.1 NAD(P)H-dependent oxidoreductase [Microbacterium sp. AB]
MSAGEGLRVVVVNGSPSESSKTAALARLAVDEVSSRYASEATWVDVYRCGPGLTSAITREDVDEATERALRGVEQADLLIVAVPVFRGAYPGMFKHFMDLVDQYALVRKPVVLLATGGSDRHALVIDHVLRPLFAFFQAYVAPSAVYASSAVFDGSLILDPGVHTRVQIAIDDVDGLLVARGAREREAV